MRSAAIYRFLNSNVKWETEKEKQQKTTVKQLRQRSLGLDMKLAWERVCGIFSVVISVTWMGGELKPHNIFQVLDYVHFLLVQAYFWVKYKTSLLVMADFSWLFWEIVSFLKNRLGIRYGTGGFDSFTETWQHPCRLMLLSSVQLWRLRLDGYCSRLGIRPSLFGLQSQALNHSCILTDQSYAQTNGLSDSLQFGIR